MSSTIAQANIQTSEGTTLLLKPRKSRFNPERVHSILLVIPSLVAVAIFVYIFISLTFYFSISNWRSLKRDLSIREPFYQTYVEMFSMPRFQMDLRNTVVFTVLFMALAICLGLFLAILLDHKLRGEAIFRNVYLFPYSLSFVVTVVSNPAAQPVTIALNNLSGSFSVDWNVVMAGAVVAALPTALIYVVLGRFFIRGLMAGSVKG